MHETDTSTQARNFAEFFYISSRFQGTGVLICMFPYHLTCCIRIGPKNWLVPVEQFFY